MLEFATFATRLYNVASLSMDKGEFCKMLFENITDLTNADEYPLDKQFDTYRAYMRGKTKITQLAKAINPFLETTSFVAYIENYSEGVLINIAKAFQDEIPDIDVENASNVGDKLSELFEAIILEASQKTTTIRKSSDLLATPEANEQTPSPQSLQDLKKLANSQIYYDEKTETLYIGESQLQIAKSIIPEKLEEHEMVYVKELLAAYSDANHAELSIESLKGKYKRDYLDQRINYFSALDIERFARETIAVGSEQANLWKSDTFDYIKPTLWNDYEDGFKRLLAVMAKVVDSKTTSVIDEFQNLVSPAAKKGICHLLVTDGQIRWVEDDE